MSKTIDDMLRTTKGATPHDGHQIRLLANHARELEAEVARLTTEYAKLLSEYTRLAEDCKRSEEDVLHNLQTAEAAVTQEQADEHGKLVLQVFTLEAEVARLKDLCLRAAGYIGVRQGPEVDEEADALLKELRGET